jgi:hypothetical protein
MHCEGEYWKLQAEDCSMAHSGAKGSETRYGSIIKTLVSTIEKSAGEKVVDAVGIEPTTSRLRVECSTN